MYVNEYFTLHADNIERLHRLKPRFGYDGFGEIVFYRTYSRVKSNGSQESWHDVVIRVVNGTMSIRKDWYKRNFINWDEAYWQKYAYEMALAMFKMYWLPAGRGMWAMGTQFVNERGSMALNNCGFTVLGGNTRLGNDLHWLMDALMLGVGVGFRPDRDDLQVYQPQGEYVHFVQDSREGWADSWKMQVEAYLTPGARKPTFDYRLVRSRGEPIKGFGGLSSGPGPLKMLHDATDKLFANPPDVVRLKADLANLCGVTVVAGNVRRSAELCLGNVNDETFMNLKDYTLNPERENWGYMSNNTAGLKADADFEMLGEVARRVVVRGEPGVANLRNFKYGRIGKAMPNRGEDRAIGLNPCGEIPLEDKELCNVVETLPTVCPDHHTWFKACEYATFYASCVSLLPTHRSETNEVVMRNRRIGVSIIDGAGWIHNNGLHKVTKYLRVGYETVSRVNRERNNQAGVPEAIRKTTIKPGGTGPKLPGKTPGIGDPTFAETLRRMRVASNAPICKVLDAANVPYEPDYFDPEGTRVYEYPMIQGPSKPGSKVTIWEQAMRLVTFSREWADNSVSNTLYFRPKWQLIRYREAPAPKLPSESADDLKHNFPYAQEMRSVATLLERPYHLFDKDTVEWQDETYKVHAKANKYGTIEIKVYQYDPNHEEDQIEAVLSSIVPLIKSCSLLPHSADGAYRQMPESGITHDEYKARLAKIRPMDWSLLKNSDGEQEKFCSGPVCEIPQK